MSVRPNERCPIHKVALLLWPELGQRPAEDSAPVQRIEDPHHPRGHWEIRSPAEMKKLRLPALHFLREV